MLAQTTLIMLSSNDYCELPLLDPLIVFLIISQFFVRTEIFPKFILSEGGMLQKSVYCTYSFWNFLKLPLELSRTV